MIFFLQKIACMRRWVSGVGPACNWSELDEGETSRGEELNPWLVGCALWWAKASLKLTAPALLDASCWCYWDRSKCGHTEVIFPWRPCGNFWSPLGWSDDWKFEKKSLKNQKTKPPLMALMVWVKISFNILMQMGINWLAFKMVLRTWLTWVIFLHFSEVVVRMDLSFFTTLIKYWKCTEFNVQSNFSRYSV